MDTYNNFFQLLTDERPIKDCKTKEPKKSKPSNPNVCSKYQSDVDALSSRYELTEGKEIVMNLKEILELCPRDRRRADAYKGLVSYLSKEYGVKLTIITNKNKRI